VATESVEILDLDGVNRALTRIAHEIIEKNKGVEDLVVIGIRTGGAYLGEQIQQRINEIESVTVPFGSIDITMYRDDLASRGHLAVGQTDIRFNLDGKRVVLVDDSVVRGTTSRKIKEMILDAGAAEVHFRIASPPTAWPCFYGVDTPRREKLLAASMSEEEMRSHLGVDSLRFISLDGLYRAVGEAGGRDPARPRYCDACFSGDYPVAPSDMIAEGFRPREAAE